ncbi:MAG TPA: V-type ATPase subunit [Clostridia bacterium]
MRETEYAYAVATIRVKENSLLSKADLEALIMSEDYRSALLLLETKGWRGIENDPEGYLDQRLLETWLSINEVSPDKEAISFLILQNDFHNAKAALKAFFSGVEAKFISPYFVEPYLFKEALTEKETVLPSFIQSAFKKAYETLSQTYDGQLAEAILDRAALCAIRQKGESSDNAFIKDICEMICAFADIKTTYRAIISKKSKDFLETALCGSASLSKESLLIAAEGGINSLFELLESSAYEKAAENLRISLAEYERFCDNYIIEYAQKAKYLNFGPEPLVAYFLARQSEIKNVRIILACKRNEMPISAIRQRERMLYV